MIFSTALALFALPLLAAATVIQGRNDSPSGATSCCQSTGTASDPAISTVLKSIGVNVQDVDALVGLTCSPVTVVGVGSGNSCSGTTVSCTNNAFLPLAAIGCVPVTL